MPVYLVHGFRWPRDGFTGIRVHIIIHNLEDSSAEYIQNPTSHSQILGSFRKAFPELMKVLDPPAEPTASHDSAASHDTAPTMRGVQLLEQYDPLDERSVLAASQPHAFVCDRVVMIAAGPGGATTSLPLLQNPPAPSAPSDSAKDPKTESTAAPPTAEALNAQALSLDVETITSQSASIPAAEKDAFTELAAKLAPGEKVGWWVIYNGDPERAYPDSEVDEDEEYEEGDEEVSDGEDEPVSPTGSDGSASTTTPKTREASVTEQSKVGVGGGSVSQPLVERKRPPQPAPKPQMFERSEHAAGENTAPLPVGGTETKGKRREIGGVEGKEREREREKEKSGKPRIVPKSESLKKKLFGGRGMGK